VRACAQEAASRGQLASPTFRRLNAVALLHGAMCLVVLAQGGSVRTPRLTGAGGHASASAHWLG
jgi:hypothetical protein